MQHAQPPAWSPPPAPQYPAPQYPAAPYSAAPYSGAPDPAAAPSAAGGAYEFSPSEDAVLRRNAMLMNAFGIVSIVVGALGFITAVFSGHGVRIIAALPETAMMIVVGVFFVRGSGGLRSVVTTKGDDIRHLLEATDCVSTAFLVQLIAVAVAFVVGVFLGPLMY